MSFAAHSLFMPVLARFLSSHAIAHVRVAALLAITIGGAASTVGLASSQAPGGTGAQGPPSASGSATPGRPPRYSRRQLQNLAKNARTAEDHDRLAAYFRARETMYRDLEAQDKKELAEYLRKPSVHPLKYPTRGDSLRHLASYHHSQAEQFAGLALEHERLAADLRAKR